MAVWRHVGSLEISGSSDTRWLSKEEVWLYGDIVAFFLETWLFIDIHTVQYVGEKQKALFVKVKLYLSSSILQ